METTNSLIDLPLPADAIEAGKAARLVRCHVSTIHRWVLKGRLAGWYRGKGRRLRRLLVSRADVLGMIEPARPTNGAPVPDCKTISAEVDRQTRAVLGRFGLA